MKTITILVLCLIFVGCRYVRNADDTVYNEVSASALLKKYEWFKDASAKLDSKLASIQVAESRLTALEKQYTGVARKEWARTDAEQSSVWAQEVAGLKMSYNSLASEYNAKMAKENYRFCNEGELPKGATKPLPRDYKPYVTN